ncbi:SSI family serine proteinase inhibitor [Cellulomonas sp. NS3]|uniref:SSI family serine proteinase inhibitor n=1 Tax=Cellulomonas sp. NS3 TaxID=2973977 RepID=UPI00216202D4|nr:SSI family serine proteinase inhibitor [Cellulomonas sp. NS3]
MRNHAFVLVVAVLTLVGCAAPREDEPGDAPSPSATPGRETTAPTPSATTEAPTAAAAPVGASLTIVLDETGSGDVRTMTLTCDPVGGDHPDPAAACAALAAAGPGAFDPPPGDALCTQLFGGPQVAVVEGTVAGTAVNARFSRTDGCEIGRWDALAPLLGSTGGV